MPWVDCTALRYHCTKHAGLELCPAAFAEGRFPPGCSSKDFVRIQADASSADAVSSRVMTALPPGKGTCGVQTL